MSAPVLPVPGLCAKVAEFRREARRTVTVAPDTPAPEPSRVDWAWKILRQHGAREGAPHFTPFDPNTPRAA